MRIRRLSFPILFFVFIFPSLIYAQVQTWAVDIGNIANEDGYSILQAKDKGYVIGGILANITPQFNNFYMVKLDSSGNLQWSKSIGGYGRRIGNNGYSVAQASDGGYVIAGLTNEYSAGGEDVYVVKVDTGGNIQWTKAIGGNQNDVGYSIILTKDKGFAITGYSESYGTGGEDVYVVKLDSAGNLQWTKTIGGNNDDEGMSIIQSRDGGYAVAGSTNSFGAGDFDVYVIKLDSTGALQWTKIIGGTGDDEGMSIIQSRDGGYAITGVTSSFADTVNGDVYVIKLDPSGNLQWTKTVGGSGTDEGHSIIQTKSGNYAVTGYTSSYGPGSADIYFITLDSIGNLMGTRTIGGNEGNYSESAIQTKSGGFALAGYSSNLHNPYNYFYVMVIDSSGNTCEPVVNDSGLISSGGITGSGGIITSTDSGYQNSGGTEYNLGEITYVCSPASGGLTITPTIVNTTCGQPNGSINLAVSGGISPYTYYWSPIASSEANAGDLSAGSYTITVADSVNDNMTIVVTVMLSAPGPTVTANVTNVTCPGNTNGSAIAIITNGSAPFTYFWSNGETSDTATGLGAGTYTIFVVDDNGCNSIDSVTITQPITLSASANIVSGITCNGVTNGSAEAIPSGGTLPYTYLWNDANSQTTMNATGLSLGTYTVTVTDSCGSSASASVSIIYTLIALANTTQNISCYGENNGSALVTISLGTPPYTYSWSDANSQSTATATGLSEGTYSVSVSDSCSNSSTASVTVTQPSSLSASATLVANVSCSEEDNGSLSSTVSGGTSPYTYMWSGIGSQTTVNATGLSAGTYTITVTDNNGCSTFGLATITQPASIGLIADSSKDLGTCNGSAWVIVTGGISPYTYLWTGGLTTDTIINQCTNYYCCTVTDANGCKDSACTTIELFTGANELISTSEEIRVYPNPTDGVFIMQIVNGKPLIIHNNIQIYNVLGEEIYSSQNNTSEQLTIDLSAQPDGVYFYRVVKETGELLGNGKITIMK